ncbi:hypothetical protein PP175_29280 (plasmid) [Aneurinibacillus sp. Ricciae_BoGa-3]|uniref:hypothetical protein n=1 Tax=Aneurinibacillus sp. Ricciae_BoGa-3 TaxID=3022697 RepID=UPI0023421937|nr:hypothetical protein [Aneurinibacillus sp. Ricciae_BoGa-3]WCK57285.1 hypothetical protein PP175_29280 [Aneurinibacillus sp. Ricciae_BoGa-3]
MIANVINQLNEKSMKYKVVQEPNGLSMAFGLITQGNKSKVVITPEEADIKVNVLDTEKTLDEPGFIAFLDKIAELRSVQEQEAKLIKELKG